MALVVTQSFAFADGTLVVHYINVGQGNSTFIQSPDGKTMLIDSGDRNGVAMTGDASADSEREMLEYHKGKLKSTVLKVGHHGSGTSTTPAFFEAVAPETTVISCGPNNPFGHPAEAVTERIKGTAIYRTDRHGTVTITSDGKTYHIATARAATTDADKAPTRLPSDVVYFSESGKRYHRDGCRYLVRSLTKMTRVEAEAKGLTPCAVCKP